MAQRRKTSLFHVSKESKRFQFVLWKEWKSDLCTLYGGSNQQLLHRSEQFPPINSIISLMYWLLNKRVSSFQGSWKQRKLILSLSVFSKVRKSACRSRKTASELKWNERFENEGRLRERSGYKKEGREEGVKEGVMKRMERERNRAEGDAMKWDEKKKEY